ncbi:PDDEXK-like family protein [Mastigocladopsis repens]|uniref:hypothetical protein n=1 Tax=Mastigocladopsis repens TaxID=221287 RepID=UPI00030D42BD|nr:hypothetical protein [Mastigocladopsis repens]
MIEPSRGFILVVLHHTKNKADIAATKAIADLTAKGYKVIYPAIKFGGCCIRTTPPKSPNPFYWWEDFTNFTEEAIKRTYKEFGVDLTTRKVNLDSRIHTRKVERPSKEELQKLVWEKPTAQISKDFGVSDKAVEKWCKAYGIEKPARGYWVKKAYAKLSE